jgi:hypothetical protein
MKEDANTAEELFRRTVAAVTEVQIEKAEKLSGGLMSTITGIFRYCISGSGERAAPEKADEMLYQAAERAKEIFCSFYSAGENREKAEEALSVLTGPGTSAEKKAETISRIWAPETGMKDDEILKRWKLTDVRPNPEPIRPTEVLIQLNALYTLPEPDNYPAEFTREAEEVLRNPGRKVADYDHPVHLFEKDEHHELINCLRELDEDLAFEKQQGALPDDYTVPVLFSVSVTHENLDGPCGSWILDRVRSLDLKHMRVIVLTEEAVRKIKEELIGEEIGVYSVFGKYGVHFNALKYTQLLLEKAYAIRGGFKLDTDEGIRSRDLHAVTGKTWIQTLCHEYWDGTAADWRGRKVGLAFNVGEYINEADIGRLGYREAMREPDVKLPERTPGGDLFFNKGTAHARATALYNRFHRLTDFISHTVVKGGGYGISNRGLRSAAPFTFSLVGRAEDQQFYFSGLAGGIRGIFHPDLRIAHYKGAVAASEKKTAVTRFLGDMYRLIIFQHLAELLEVKEDIDPMPGVFAGPLARAQVFFHTLYKALLLVNDGDADGAEILLGSGWRELEDLMAALDSGEIGVRVEQEREEWKEFIRAADSAEPEKTRSVLEQFIV